MHGGKHCSRHQSARPDHARRSDEITTSEAGECVSEYLRRDGEKELVDYTRVLMVKLDLFDNNLGQ